MNTVWPILFGAAFAGLTALSLGLMIVQALRLPLHRQEARLLGFLLGAAALSTLVFVCTALWISRPLTFAVIGAAAIGFSFRRGAWRYGCDVNLQPVPVLWRWLFVLGLLAYGTFTLMHAMAPEASPDGTAYHLGTVARYLRQGGFAWYTTSMYMNLPMGVEMLFLFAFAFGKHSAAALVHWQFFLALPLLLLMLGRRFGHAPAGAAAGLLVFCSPVFGIDGSSAYVDVATGTVAFGLFYLLVVWEQQRSRGLLVCIGLLAGFSYACKMTGFPAVPFAIGFVAWKSWRTRQPWFRPALVVGLFAAVIVAPWLVKNTLMVGNPFSPFLNAWFPNPYVKISFEEEYRAAFRDYYGRIKSPLQIPLEVTVRGASLHGLLGPVFLLAPLALLALRWPLGRRALLAAAIFATAYPGNIGTRFLLSVVPFVAFAMGMVLSNWKGMATAIVLFHGFVCWPDVVRVYSDQYAWTLERFRFKQAFRIEPEEAFLERVLPDYKLARLIEQKVRPDGRVLTFGGVPEAYTSRDIAVAYQSGWNNILGELLATGVSPDFQGIRSWDFIFPSRTVRRVRIVQTGTSRNMWSVSEVRLFYPGGGEVPRDQLWRIRSVPNPWEVQMAFDNCEITRWRTWEPARPGMFIEVDVGKPVPLGGVRVFISPDQVNTSARLEAEVSPGKWEAVLGAPSVYEHPTIENARRIAVNDLKRYGVTHLSIQNDEFIASELFLNRSAWGITLIGESRQSRLYQLN